VHGKQLLDGFIIFPTHVYCIRFVFQGFMGLLSVFDIQPGSFHSHSLLGRNFGDNGFNETLPHPQNASDNDFSGVIFSGWSGGVFTVYVTG
jgi:hypothetical protein|tara:strand:- start:139 stop:411 length:273 start_codon:yes stop_codon:yes gene_type:complete